MVSTGNRWVSLRLGIWSRHRNGDDQNTDANTSVFGRNKNVLAFAPRAAKATASYAMAA
jgi:hypothetical protein